ncbi:MAG TPA: ornithine cyclodeaminase family protein [Chthoniobacterales bacterium]|nr:ornithine cyclodeaminase family protein [Chthoniobacterales bacterium]
MGKMRTAATTAVATRLLARANARVVACFGTGRHGGFQLDAVCAVRTIDEVKVFGRNEARVANFCATMSKKLDVAVRAVKTPREAVAGADIINVMTPSPTPVFDGAWLEPGQHINAAGSNALDRRELDLETIKRSDVIVVDSREVAELECGDLLPAFEAGLVHWKHLPELADIIAGRHAARSSDQQITLFESQGMCIEDLYVGKYVLDTAKLRNIGIDLPIDD